MGHNWLTVSNYVKSSRCHNGKIITCAHKELEKVFRKTNSCVTNSTVFILDFYT